MAQKTSTKDLRGMSDEQLGLTLKDTEKHLFQLRLQSATDRLETPSEITKAKKEIARIKTHHPAASAELEKLGKESADLDRGETEGHLSGQAARPRQGIRAYANRQASLQAAACRPARPLRRRGRAKPWPTGLNHRTRRSTGQDDRSPRHAGRRHPRQDDQDPTRRG